MFNISTGALVYDLPSLRNVSHVAYCAPRRCLIAAAEAGFQLSKLSSHVSSLPIFLLNFFSRRSVFADASFFFYFPSILYGVSSSHSLNEDIGTDGGPIQSSPSHKAPVTCVDYSPAFKTFASGAEDGTGSARASAYFPLLFIDGCCLFVFLS